MDSGKILPAIRVLLRGQGSVNKSSDKNSHQNRDDGREQKKKKPSQAEILKALEILKADENFQKNGLQAALEILDGEYVICVKNHGGAILRSIKGEEIFSRRNS